MQLPAGQLAHMYGGKNLLVWATLLSGVASALIPWSAHVVSCKILDNYYDTYIQILASTTSLFFGLSITSYVSINQQTNCTL